MSDPGEHAPTILHVTHPKSGSTWITGLFKVLGGPRFVKPKPLAAHVVPPLQEGGVYPRVYVSREIVESYEAPGEVRVMLTIRDPRDTLISGYWSLRDSHAENGGNVPFREKLQSVDQAEGLVWLMDQWLPNILAIPLSWVGHQDAIRYEDMLADEAGTLVPELSGRLGLGTPEEVERALRAQSFKNRSGGREPGQEDRGHHFRKGVAGDWRNYLHEGDAVTEAFKERFADTLILLGYEDSDDW